MGHRPLCTQNLVVHHSVAYTIFDHILDQMMYQAVHNQLDHYIILHQLLQNIEHALSNNYVQGVTYALFDEQKKNNNNILYLLEKFDHIS
jgi:hypothetical protein